MSDNDRGVQASREATCHRLSLPISGHHLECIRLARERVFGDVRLMEAGFGFPIGDPKQWRLNHALAGGGALMDVGIYALQATRMVVGEEPILVSAQETKTDPVKFKEVDESMTWELKFPAARLRIPALATK